MKRISIIVSTTFVFMILACSVVFNACTKDLCKDLICKNNGVCRDGRCKCALGYEGPNCDTRMYEKFIGTWEGSYRCNGTVPDLLTNIIGPGSKANEVIIYDLFNQTYDVTATVDVDKIDIATQNVGNFTYTGNGYVEGNYITIFINQKDNTTGNINACVYNATKYTNP